MLQQVEYWLDDSYMSRPMILRALYSTVHQSTRPDAVLLYVL